jgi:hypothetical protein
MDPLPQYSVLAFLEISMFFLFLFEVIIMFLWILVESLN